jgi:hypothetical protein
LVAGPIWLNLANNGFIDTDDLIDEALAHHAGVRHTRIDDARRRPPGRSFRVRLWPTSCSSRPAGKSRTTSRLKPSARRRQYGTG